MVYSELDPLLVPFPQPRNKTRILIFIPVAVLIIICGAISYTYSIVNERFYFNGICATDNKVCSRIGVGILKDGGNAVDASIAAALCLGTISPFASGIGGGGFALVGGPNTKAQFFNFREKAPQSAYPDMFVKNPVEAQVGAKSVGVPGELLGLYKLHLKYGALSWDKLFIPSINLAKNGFKVTGILLKRLTSAKTAIFNDPGLRNIYTKVVNNNRVLVEYNDLVKRSNYAKTLQDISINGVHSFYRGNISRILVDFLSRHGGILTNYDFGNYTIISSDPLHITYRGYDVYTTKLPSGGPVLAMMLKIMENFKLPSNEGDSVDYHRMIEAMKWGYAQRSYFGDPLFVPNITDKIKQMLSNSYIDSIFPRISNDITYEPSHCKFIIYYTNIDDSDYSIAEDHGTTHLSTVDKDGLAVSLTSTVNLNFGSKMMEPITGIVLNDQLDDFSIPGKSNYFGLKPSTANYIAPGKRPQSSTAPALVLKGGKLVLNIGGSGGSRIGTAVFQTILRVLDLNIGVNHAIQLPRIHHQLFPNVLEIEGDFGVKLIDELHEKNHTTSILAQAYSAVQGIHLTDSKIYGGSDHRKNGRPAGY